MNAPGQGGVYTAENDTLGIAVKLRRCKALKNLIAVAQVQGSVDSKLLRIQRSLTDKLRNDFRRRIRKDMGENGFRTQSMEQLPCKQREDIHNFPVFQIQDLGMRTGQNIDSIAVALFFFQHGRCAEDFRFLAPKIACIPPVCCCGFDTGNQKDFPCHLRHIDPVHGAVQFSG